MNKRLFFLSREGWFEEEVSDKMLHASQEELVLWAYAMMERKNYRNYLITENPERVMKGRTRPVIASHSTQIIKLKQDDPEWRSNLSAQA